MRMPDSLFLSMGAEATLQKKKMFGQWVVEKTRVPKKYRHPDLDARLRKERTANEARLLHHVKTFGIISPILFAVDKVNANLTMEYIDAPRLKHVLLSKKESAKSKKILCTEFGKIIATLHGHGIVHGDLTTSNVLVRKTKKGNEPILIDFGLGFHSQKMEDWAVDLVNLKKTFTATHSSFPLGWGIIHQSYLKSGGKKETLKKMEEVEARIRYA
jgi:Kae1-associated kinase Bud32